MQILIVEDKRALAGQLGRALEREGHSVTLAHDGDDGLRLGRTNIFDLLIVDVMLPRQSGLSVVRRLREDKLRTQTIMVSARDSMEDVILGLDAGADDYMTKPFALDILLAKVRASSRRAPDLAVQQDLQLGDLVFRPHRFELQRGERTASLTRTECALLEALMRHTRAVVSQAALLEAGWGGEAEGSCDSLYVFIRALRLKISQPGEQEMLHTVRGVGYCLRAGRA